MSEAAALVEAVIHLQAAKYFLVAAFVMLVYDHLITFSDEVERIWKQPWSGATLLFALIRYVTLFQQPIIIAAFTSAAWTKNVRPACEHFVRFEGGSTIALVAICEIIMMLRVYAIWQRDNRVLVLLVFFWVMQIALCSMALSFGKRVPLPPGFIGCILTGANNLWAPFWIMPLITDTAVFALTLLRVKQYSKGARNMPLLKLFVRDGALYFLCIFSANLLNVILFLVATNDLKAIGAGFSQIITCVMVSRLVLNLRNLSSGSHRTSGRFGTQSFEVGEWKAHERPQQRSLFDTVIGVLGEGSDATSGSTEEDTISRTTKPLGFHNELPMVGFNEGVGSGLPSSL